MPEIDQESRPDNDTETDTDVVVIGAGISGLSVALGLQDAGVAVAVLEARDRVGGRLLSVDDLDLGATWYWPNEGRIARLMERLGLTSHPQFRKGDAVYQDPTRIVRLEGNPIDVESSRFSGGAQLVAEALAERLHPHTVRLGEPVHAIDGRDARVVLATPRAEVSAQQVVLALPPALVDGSITITPPLDPALAALARQTPVWMGATAKVVVHYATPFWREVGLSGSAMSHSGPLREIHDMSGPSGDPAALFGFAAGEETDSGALSEDRIRSQLIDLFGAQASNPIRILIQDWSQEAFTSPPGSSRLTRHDLFGHPLYAQPALDGRLHWASTETVTEFPGHIEGALAAAERAIAAILDSTAKG